MLAKSSAAILLSSQFLVQGADAATHNYNKTESPTLPYPSNSSVYHTPNHTNSATNKMVQMDSSTCSHVSGIVNGHFSSIPAVNATYQVYTLKNTHTSHANHCSCSRWM